MAARANEPIVLDTLTRVEQAESQCRVLAVEARNALVALEIGMAMLAQEARRHARHSDAADQLLTVADAAARLDCDDSTIWTLLRQGKLPSVKYGRIRRVRESDLAAWIDAHLLDAH